MSDVRVVVISGPSGVGKSTLIKALLSRPGVRLAVSATTRSPRTGEADGVDYHFLSTDRFEALRSAGDLLEWAEVHGSHYGTPSTEVDGSDGETVILDIDVQGWRSVKSLGMDALGVFIAPPSPQDLERRLRTRASEDETSLETRLRNATRELDAQNEYDHVVVNDDVERATRELLQLVLRTPQGNGA